MDAKDISSTPAVMCAPVTNDKEWYKSDNVAPLFEGLDVLEELGLEFGMLQREFHLCLKVAQLASTVEALSIKFVRQHPLFFNHSKSVRFVVVTCQLGQKLIWCHAH